MTQPTDAGTRCVVVDSPIGPLTLTATGDALTGVTMSGQLHLPEPVAGVPRSHDDRLLREAAGQLAAYFGGELARFDLPLDPRGTGFQRAVWAALADIPYGQTRSYAQIAAAVGAPTAFRAVGTANGRNPVPIVLPCHRVIGAGGALTGYGGGLERKRWLLDHEARHSPNGPSRPMLIW